MLLSGEKSVNIGILGYRVVQQLYKLVSFLSMASDLGYFIDLPYYPFSLCLQSLDINHIKWAIA